MPDNGAFIVEDGIMAWFDGPEWDDVAEAAFKDAAQEVQTIAQADAPWEDRSGDARSGLETSVSNDDGLIELSLFHTVEYGLWLEVIQNGNFAIIMPTLEQQAPRVFQEAADKVASARKGNN